MARVRTVDFLPEIFQTPVNRQFLSATLDQLVQEPSFIKSQGYIGRKVGPGVNPQDRYIIEPTKSRNDYQLEPGVVEIDPKTLQIKDAITYPGINDALSMQGAFVDDANRLYSSDYYSWDPFVDFDKFINYQQYYWLPGGPLAVDVSATTVPLTDNFVVTRENGVYTFSGIGGNNPALTLIRGGNYTFEVAQNDKQNINFRVTNDNTSAYVIDYQPNPTLTLVRGNTYTFTFSTNGVYPFYIKTQPSLGNTNTYNTGVTNNGAVTGTLTFVVPQDAPDTLYYCSANQYNMRGTFNVVNGTPGTGPGFWIQSDPGVDGRLPYAPNISSRDVLGVENNGEDLGTVTFNVPLSTAQDFYYNLTDIGPVSLITGLQYDQINGQPVDEFILEHNGIDGIVDLNNRTLVFQPNAAGWGTVPENQRYQIWQIRYVTGIDNVEYIQLSVVQEAATYTKFTIQFGTQWSGTSWYKTAEGFFSEIPLLTAVKSVLYYQDGTDPAMFGEIKLINQTGTPTLDISQIVGRKTYTSPNGVVFTNGLKVTFRGSVNPESYQNQSYYVEGVGTAIKLIAITDFVTPETYTLSETVPYASTPYDIGNYDATLNAPEKLDYLTINRASPDLNAWTRSNRWFHIDVINASAEYNNTIPVVDNAYRARRPILEYRAGTRLYNFGTEGKQPVNIIDFKVTDALSNINGTTGYSVDGYNFVEGSRVIFAIDTDISVRNKIYVVQFVTPDSVPPLTPQPIINLVPAEDADVLYDQTVVCLSGQTLQGKSFWFDGVTWQTAQQKTGVNQPPLFNIYDSSGISFDNRDKYPSSTFTGSKLFSYAQSNSGSTDPVLGFALKYLSLTNIGDIVFDNNLYTDTFVYVTNSVSTTTPVSSGFVRQYSDRVNYVREIGWQTAATTSIDRQQFSFTYNGKPLQLDIKVSDSTVVPAVQLFKNSTFQDPGTYTVSTTATTTKIILNSTYVIGDVIEVAVISDQVSATAFYQIPINLENNPFNINSPIFTLGTARSHYDTIGQNLIGLQGPINGANNTRDLGNIIPYGLQILQQSSPLSLAGYFVRNLEYDIFASLSYNSREYVKFKSLLLDTVVRNDYSNLTVSEILDAAVYEITRGRTNLNPFYWSDMLPSGSVYTERVNTITAISTSVFDTLQTYDFTSANFKGLLVYLTYTLEDGTQDTRLLERDLEYTVSTTGPTLTVEIPLNPGNIITIREYESTAGNFVPNTPSKMGLYPKFLPRVFYDTNYVNPTLVIQGHDGSITVAFGDIRDQILFEFEKRIYNNIKTDGNPVPLTIADVAPGFFRTTDYTQTEITDILSESFLSWVGWNKLDYKSQDYIANNPFTYNYSTAGSKLVGTTVTNINEEPLLGAWRGIYRYFYDTLTPNDTPWEMLGFSEKPSWWESRYGIAPYTSDNLVLWDDLEAGLVADPAGPYIIPKYRRPGLTSVIPVGTEGQLLNPLESVVGAYDPTSFRKSWVVGDGGPVEASWWQSSSYPFAVMRLLALTRPAEFFSVFADRDLYRYNAEFDQYLYNGRYRLDASATNPDSINRLVIYGDGTSKASYINWIVDYNQQLGRSSSTVLSDELAYLDVRLCYRMAAFTNKQYLKIFTEKSSPNSTNSGLLLPDDSYGLLLYKNQPFAEIVYSALIIEKVNNGYSVSGYSNTAPYFKILASSSSGLQTTVSAGGATVRVPVQYTNNIVQIPYGYVFTNTTMVVDFILSYGAYLATQGLIFTDVENGYILNWSQMAQEFLYFSQQGWAPGTLINLNPAATKLMATKPGAVVDTIESLTPENMVLDQNKQTLHTRDVVIDRYENTFTITSLTNQTISYLHLRFTNYENMVVLDNVSIFADLVYDPATAARQNRLKVVASLSNEWNGQLDARGFIDNNTATVKEWQPIKKYTKGEIVLYKNIYWSAQGIVQPKAKFDFTDWVKADYTAISPGLLPNLANKADQLANTYNTYSANLERDNDLLSYGLIGFRPRQYMAALDLDDVSQVNIYQQFLGTKGTNRAAEIFTRADLGKESGAYEIFENWAVLAGTYGANANRSFIELRLFENLLQADPCTVEIVLPQQSSDADQEILLSNIWRESYKITSTNILPTAYTTITDTALPTAGYVNLDEVDITVFSVDDPTSIAQNIDIVGIGTIIWIAKTNAYDWGIFRCEEIPGRLQQITDNLNETSVAFFTAAHNLSVGDLIIIRYFNSAVDGVYRVISVPGIQQVIIAFSFTNTSQTSIIGDGLAFRLESSRVAQASDIANLSYANSLLPGARAWVDNDGSGHWVVLEKQQPFTEFARLYSEPLVSNSQFGSSIAQSADYFNALVGAPNNNTAGSVFTYLRDLNDNYAPNINLVLDAPDVAGFGNAVDFGNKTWGIVGASASRSNTGYAQVLYLVPGSNNYIFSQLLVAPDQNFGPNRFGYAVTISQDERWLYVSAPWVNTVYAYGRVDVQSQSVSYLADGVQSVYNYSNHIRINYLYPNQLEVSIDNNISGTNVDLIYAVDYIVSTNDITLLKTPSAGLTVNIRRRQAAQLDSRTYYGVLQNTTSGSGIGSAFTVNVTRGVYYTTLIVGGSGYAVGDTLTIYGAVLGGSTPGNNEIITVTTVDSSGAITGFTTSGSSISTTRTFQLNPYLYTATNIYSFTVIVNGQLQRPHIDYEFNTDSTDSTQDLTFINNPGVGAVISVVSNTYWQYVHDIKISGLNEYARFGTSLTTTTDGRQVLIGCSQDDAVNNSGQTIARAGSVYAIDRSVVSYQITDATQYTYAIPGTVTAPVSVLLNNVFLTDNAQYINGQFTISGSNVVLSSSVTLTVGDILEIETNKFQTLQKFTANNPTDESGFGTALEICSNNCSVYTGAPYYSLEYVQQGSVQRNVNQSRVYGVITSTIANPSLTVGDTIRINNFEVAVPTTNTIAGLIAEINSRLLPNVAATSTPDLTFVGDGITQTFDIGNLYSIAESYTTVVYVNSVLQTYGFDYTYNATTQQIIFVTAPFASDVILVVSGRMTISIINKEASVATEKLTVLPGVIGSAFDSIGFETYAYTQTITSPRAAAYDYFGSSVSIDTNSINLVVGAPNATTYIPTQFDNGNTIFDDNSTTFFSSIKNSGDAYTFDYLSSANESINNVGQFVFGQQVYDTVLNTNDRYGQAVSYRKGRLLIGAPGNDKNVTEGNYGLVTVFNNPNNEPSWTTIHIQEPSVIIDQINSVFMYDRLTSKTETYFDYIDPLQGKILGVAKRNIDYSGAVDPASYNVGSVHNNGNSWGESHLNEIWWDTNTVRFINPNQDNITYASRRWGTVFPGSRVDVYQWIASSVAPVSYTGPGIPLSLTSYSVSSKLNKDNLFETIYYFWVRGLTSIAVDSGKTLSATGIAQYIENPRGSGIPFIAPLSASSVAIYNGLEFISAQDTILHIAFDRQLTAANIHQEYQLIADGKADSFLNSSLYRKLIDSFVGTDVAGASVPDPLLSPPERYGVQFRPRQSMFINRFLALENYLTHTNRVLLQFPIVEIKSLSLLNSSEPEPAAGTGAWNKRVANLEELSYQNLAEVSLGYRYLVVSDSGENGLWTIYQVENGLLPGERITSLIRVQNYDTRQYWYTTNWYRIGYNSTIDPIVEVPVYSALSTLSLATVPVGSSAKVTANAQGKFEIYLRTDLGWERVGLQDGTIQIKEEIWNYSAGNFGFDVEVFDAQFFDQEPTIETRQILLAINQQLLTDDLLIERNRLLMLMFEFVYTEFEAPEWLMKTSLIDVNHNIRALLPFPNYLRDNQDFVLDYINEVKPYHVQIREFNLTYDGTDAYPGSFTDFDVPAYWDTNLVIPQFVSPILLPYTQSGSVVSNNNSDAPSNSEIWLVDPWTEWYNNYLLTIQQVVILDGGIGYTEPPSIVVTGDCIEQATMVAKLNTAGQISEIEIVSPGVGYRTTAVITFVGGNGINARAVTIMGNDLIRSVKTTIKYDRYQYQTSIVPWQANTNYENGTLVRYSDRVWSASSPYSSVVNTSTFLTEYWTLVNADTLSGVDRTMGLYLPTVNEPGLSLPLLIDGVEYPGVQVSAPNFSQNTGFDVGNFDINPFDNISYGPEGLPTYDPSILNAIYGSQYLDVYLGTRPTDVNVDGGAYIDTYSSYAPEELIPGSEFDTLDFRVYTTPGSDWLGNGHGFPAGSRRYIYDPLNPVLNFADILPIPMTVLVFNATLGLAIEPVSYDWVNYEVTVGATETIGDLLVVYVTGVGGGNQLYNNTYLGNDIGNTIIVPFPYNSIYQFLIYNGEIMLEPGVDYTFKPLSTPVSTTYVSSTSLTLEVADTRGILPGALIIGTGFESNQIVVSVQSSTNLTISAVPDSTPFGTLNFYNVSGKTEITFAVTYDETNRINLSTLGYAPPGYTTYSWSLPVFETLIADGGLTFDIINSLQGTNPINLMVLVNGARARPSESVLYTGNGTQTIYDLPADGGYSQGIIANNDVSVYVNNVGLINGVDFIVNPWDGSSLRTVTLTTAPKALDQIIVAVRTGAQYWIVGNQLIFQPSAGLIPILGDVIEIITWNDTAQQGILTQVFVGPTSSGTQISEGFDTTGFSYGDLNDEPGSFDYTLGNVITSNYFDTGRPITNPERLVVTLNGNFIFYGIGYAVQGSTIVIQGLPISATAIVVITSFTQSVVTGAMAFRIFQDMRGLQLTYRITPKTTTYLERPLAEDDDIIYVNNIMALGDPNLDANILGVITIDGERIMYRNRDVVTSTVYGLRRGTAGTGATSHDTGAIVYDLGRSNLLEQQFQNYVVSDTALGDGSTVSFDAPNISVYDFEDSTLTDDMIEVYVGGTRVNNRVVGLSSGNSYYISSLGNTDWHALGVAYDVTPVVGLQFTAGDPNVTAGNFVIGKEYTITSVGNTNFVLIGASSNDIGISFIATGVGQGTGTVVAQGSGLVDYVVTSTNSVVVEFVEAPQSGVEVTLLVRRGVTWYAPGNGTPSNGVPLQDTDTMAARFLRGLS